MIKRKSKLKIETILISLDPEITGIAVCNINSTLGGTSKQNTDNTLLCVARNTIEVIDDAKKH